MRGGHGTDLDFKRINEAALANPGFLQGRLPKAKRQGRELVAGDIHGNPGKSFSCNTETGVWSDFATGESGGDIISLVATQEELGQAKAARMIAEEIGLAPVTPKPKRKDLPETPIRQENLVATFRYEDEAGRFLFAVDRYEAPNCRKAIRQWHLDENGKRINSVKGVRLAPFRLPELLRAETVFIVEGEQKVQELADWGLAATCNPMGAGKWREEFNPHFQVKQVVILPDNDTPGRNHARKVAKSLLSVAASVKIVELPGLPPKGDIVDWIKAGHGRDELLRLVEVTATLDPASEDDSNDACPATEDAIALLFAREHKDDLRYCHETGAWFVWTGSHWRVEKTRLAFAWARKLCRKAVAGMDNKKVAATLSKAATAGAVERFAQTDRAFAVTSEIWDADLHLLGTPDGVVDLRTGTLRPARREDYITKLAAVAPARSSDAPIWRRFLDEATQGDAMLQRFMQQVAGYALTGDISEHALFFIYGPGGNGKSVFLNTLTNILGDYAATAAMDTFTASQGDRHPTDLAMLRGARLVSVSETEEGRPWAESRIKQLTGGDKISARFMRQDFFTYTPQFKLLIVGNHKPVLRNVDEAARRRFNIIPFIHKPTSPDKRLEDKLKAEYPAILRWMIEGCLDWRENGLLRPESVKEATAAYFDEQDLFGQWIEECCEVGPRLVCKTAELFESWKGFAERNGEHPGSTKAFSANLCKREFIPGRTMNSRHFKGITLRRQEEWQDSYENY